VALSEIDKQLIDRCLAHHPRAWEDFVDRFLGLVVHVINHTGESRSLHLSEQDREDFAADVFLAVLSDNFAVLRRFRGHCSLATYLTVIARRVVVRELLKRKVIAHGPHVHDVEHVVDGSAAAEERIANREEVERLLEELSPDDADIVRLYHLDGKSYHEISEDLGIPENSIGPTLSRARARLKRLAAEQAVKQS
jgi:RNA polymerase sigma-70 factor (ECF subfamily)